MDIDRAKSVDFSSFVSTDYYNIIIPLRTENDMWSFFGPFDYEIWILFIFSIPILILVMSLSEYPSGRTINWRVSVELVSRNALSESFQSYRRVYKILWNINISHKALIIIWIWSCFVLMKSYAGNLTAMITRPKLSMKYTMLQDFLDQDELSLVIEEGVHGVKYMKQSPINSTMRRIIDQTQILSLEEEWPSVCFPKSIQYTKRHASICDNSAILGLLSDDFSEHAKCNWYTMEEGFFHGILVLAFQVDKQQNIYLLIYLGSQFP